jgi:hypothetical protein
LSENVIIAIIAFILAMIAVIYYLFRIKTINLCDNFINNFSDNNYNKSYLLMYFYKNNTKKINYKKFSTNKELSDFIIQSKNFISVIESVEVNDNIILLE